PLLHCAIRGRPWLCGGVIWPKLVVAETAEIGRVVKLHDSQPVHHGIADANGSVGGHRDVAIWKLGRAVLTQQRSSGGRGGDVLGVPRKAAVTRIADSLRSLDGEQTVASKREVQIPPGRLEGALAPIRIRSFGD